MADAGEVATAEADEAVTEAAAGVAASEETEGRGVTIREIAVPEAAIRANVVLAAKIQAATRVVLGDDSTGARN